MYFSSFYQVRVFSVRRPHSRPALDELAIKLLPSADLSHFLNKLVHRYESHRSSWSQLYGELVIADSLKSKAIRANNPRYIKVFR